MALSPSGEPKTLWALAYLTLAIIVLSGAVAGVRQGKFVLGRRLGFSPNPISRDERPILFWLVALTLAGLGVLSLVALLWLQP
jgi:hypothetical protein